MTAEQSTYALSEGATLVVRADERPWQTVTFTAAMFADIGAAGADEVAAAIDTLDGLTGSVDPEGRLVVASEETGEQASVEVDLSASTAAAALGLTAGRAGARGQGLGAARLIGRATEPFTLPARASMTVQVDGRTRRVTLHTGRSSRSMDAAAVAKTINTTVRRAVARATADGRVMLVSPTIGLGSRLAVTRPRDADVPDAAAVLGFVGQAASADPYRSEPARLVCAGTPGTATVENLTAAPIELQLPTGRAVLPARGRLVVARDMAAEGLLSRLAQQGSVRVSSGSL
jgi:hypothetical protein